MKRIWMVPTIILAAAFGLAACGSSGGNGQETNDGNGQTNSGEANLVSIAVQPTNPSIAKGTTQQFTATGTYSDYTTKDLTASVTWSSSDATVATISGSGWATAVTAGITAITATSSATTGSKVGSTTLTVSGSGATTSTPNAWQMFGHEAQHTGRSSYAGIQASGSNLKWTKSGVGDVVSNEASESDITIGSDGTIYALYYSYAYSILHAINPTTGSSKWTHQVKDLSGYSIMAYGTPTIGKDGTIYIGDEDGYIHAINAVDGSLKWKHGYIGFNSPNAPFTISDDGTIYAVGCDCDINNAVIAIHPDGTKKWSYIPSDTNIASLSPAIGADGTVYVGIRNNGAGTGGIAAIDADGTLKWRGTFGVAVTPTLTPAIGPDGTIYIGTNPYFGAVLYAINPDCTLKWAINPSSYGFDVLAPSIAADGTIYVSAGNTLFALNPSNGSTKWQSDLAGTLTTYGLPVLSIDSAGSIYVGTEDYLYAFNSDGSAKWNYFSSYAYFSSPKIGSNGALYVSTGDGLKAYGP